jgi:hypothetical protein
MLTIDTVNIHITLPDRASKTPLDGLGKDLAAYLAVPRFATGGVVGKRIAIGEVWPGADGVYAGISRGENGEPDAHLVLLNAKPKGRMSWHDAMKWAQEFGDGARLPTRFESALLYAHLQGQFDADAWHWTSTQYSEDRAWSQFFSGGTQGGNGKEFEALARLVRRFPL